MTFESQHKLFMEREHSMSDSCFKASDQSIVGHRGFAMEFPNGYSVSVQWGWMCYCSNRNTFGSHQERLNSPFDSKTAEVMIMWKGEGISSESFPQGLAGRWQDFFDRHGIAADLSVDSVAKLLSDVAYLTDEPI
jgi:hypothetical protein